MKNYIWKNRIVLGLLVILLVQLPFVALKLTISDQKSVYALVEAAHILLSSGLAGYLFSKTFESFLENRLYGGFRRNWKEVRVMYSDGFYKGMGEAYPREPTLLIQPPSFDISGSDSPRYTDKDSLVAQSLNGRSYVITAPIVHGPMSVSFNTGYVGQPVAGEDTSVTGKWSDLQLIQIGPSGCRITRVGFPDTLITLGKARTLIVIRILILGNDDTLVLVHVYGDLARNQGC